MAYIIPANYHNNNNNNKLYCINSNKNIFPSFN